MLLVLPSRTVGSKWRKHDRERVRITLSAYDSGFFPATNWIVVWARIVFVRNKHPTICHFDNENFHSSVARPTPSLYNIFRIRFPISLLSHIVLFLFHRRRPPLSSTSSSRESDTIIFVRRSTQSYCMSTNSEVFVPWPRISTPQKYTLIVVWLSLHERKREMGKQLRLRREQQKAWATSYWFLLLIWYFFRKGLSSSSTVLCGWASSNE